MASHTFTMIDHHRAVVFGGRAESGKMNETFVLDMKTWVRITCVWPVHTVHFVNWKC